MALTQSVTHAQAQHVRAGRRVVAGDRSLAKTLRHAPSARVVPKAARRGPTAMAATLEEQDAAFRKAEKRWQNSIAEGKVKNVDAKTAGQLIKEGWVLLDVRAPEEFEKVGVKGAVVVPLFVPETEMNFPNLLKIASNFGMGGWWLGGTHMKPNESFMGKVQAAVPKDAKVIVACQKGLRSLAAAEQLSRAGYPTLAWINGGLDTARGDDLPSTDGRDLRWAGVGGVSELLGWSEVQRQEGKSLFDGDKVVKVGATVLVLDLLLFVYEHFTAVLGQP